MNRSVEASRSLSYRHKNIYDARRSLSCLDPIERNFALESLSLFIAASQKAQSASFELIPVGIKQHQ